MNSKEYENVNLGDIISKYKYNRQVPFAITHYKLDWKSNELKIDILNLMKAFEWKRILL